MDHLTLEASLKNTDRVLAFVNQYLEQLGCGMKTQMEIDLAVEELFVNIANYAYNPATGSATVEVETQPDPPTISITLADQGVPYNPLAKEDPELSPFIGERPIGGLGIFIAKNSMDHIEYAYEKGRNILNIKKIIDG